MSRLDTASNTLFVDPNLEALYAASRVEVPDTLFEREFLGWLSKSLDCSGIGIWFDPGTETVYLRHKRDLPAEELQRDLDVWKRHGLLLKHASQSEQPRQYPPGWEEGEAGNQTSASILAASATVIGKQRVVVEIFRNPAIDEDRSVERDLKFLSRVAEFAADRMRAQQIVSISMSHGQTKKIDQFAQLSHGSLDPERTAYVIANEAASLLGCQRVSVAVRQGTHVAVLGMSGQTVINRRANLIRSMERLGDAVLDSPKAVIISPRVRECEKPQTDALDAYIAESHAKTLYAIPLRSQPTDRSVGVLFIEQFDEEVTAETMADRVPHVAAHTTTAVKNALSHDRIFLRKIRSLLGQTVAESKRLRSWIILLILAALISAFIFVPMTLRIEGKGTLQAEVRRGVFATESGVVREIHAAHGKQVHAGDKLAVIENIDLKVQLQQGHEELTSATETIKTKEAERSQRGIPAHRQIQLDGEIVELNERVAYLKNRIKLLQSRDAQLTVLAPMDGTVVTWEASQQLQDRPVVAGNLLVQIVSETEPWRIEVQIPEGDASPVLQRWNTRASDERIEVEYLLATHPEERYRGWLREISLRTDNLEHSQVIYAVITPDPDSLPPLRDGAEVRAKIVCGESSLGFVMFRQVVNFFHSRILFLF